MTEYPVSTVNYYCENLVFGNTGFWNFWPAGPCAAESITWTVKKDIILDRVILTGAPDISAGKAARLSLTFLLPESYFYAWVFDWQKSDAYTDGGYVHRGLTMRFPAGTKFLLTVSSTEVGNAVPRFLIQYHYLDETLNKPADAEPCRFTEYVLGRCHG